MFIVLDGPDGSGTSFHARHLAEKLKSEGREVLLTAEPTTGPIGRLIREVLKFPPPFKGEGQGEGFKEISSKPSPQSSPLKGRGGLSPDTLQLLFTADRAAHQAEIRTAIDAGKTVICDRYYHSTYAYGLVFDLDLAWLKNMNKNFIRPDTVIFTLPPLSVCLERMGRRAVTDSFERNELQEKVVAVYEELARADSSIHTVDTSGEKEDVAEHVYGIIHP